MVPLFAILCVIFVTKQRTDHVAGASSVSETTAQSRNTELRRLKEAAIWTAVVLLALWTVIRVKGVFDSNPKKFTYLELREGRLRSNQVYELIYC